MSVGDYSDGAWDCSHAFDVDMHRDAWRALGRPSDPEAAINVVRKAWADNDDDGASWIEANGADIVIVEESKGTVDPRDEFIAWRDAWQACAIGYVRRLMTQWAPCAVCGGTEEGNTCCP